MDRVLVNQAWLSTSWNTSVEAHARPTSDHCPLILKVVSQPAVVSKPFRFQHFWVHRLDFLELVRASWCLPVAYHGPYGFAWKLKRLKGVLRDWNRNVIGNIFHNMSKAEGELRALEARFDASGDNSDLILLNAHQAHYLCALADEEAYWKQSARTRWLQDGDRNTKFFHASTVERRARLFISRIKNDADEWLTEQDSIRDQATIYFQYLLIVDGSLLTEAMVDSFLQHIPSLVKEGDNLELLAPVTLNEVRNAVFALDPDSSPGVDGFFGTFYRSCWDIISDDLLMAVKEFFMGIPIPRVISSTQIILLPKKDNPNSFADFRPISLCTFLYKIFTRIICDRLGPLLLKLISPK